MKKLLLTLGTAASIVAPLATTVACGSATLLDNGTVVTYAPDLDMALALEMDVTSTHHFGGNGTEAIIKQSGNYDDELAKIVNENDAFWDFGNFDEEYWLSLNADTLIGEYWVGAERRERMEKIVPQSAFFDYNYGVQGEEFVIQINDESAADEDKTWRIANDEQEIYGNPDDYWQMIDMPAFLKQSAEALDALDHIDGKVELADKIIDRTAERWEFIRKEVLSDDAATLPAGPIFTSVLNESKGSLENLMVLGMSTTETLNPTVSTPSNMKGLYANSGYNYPELTLTQADALAAKGGNWSGMADATAKIADKSQVDNGISFNSDDAGFYEGYNGKIDKMIISLPDDIRNASTKAELVTELNDNTVVKNMFAANALTVDNVMFVSPYLAGGAAYSFRQPIGQNTLMDQMATEWLGVTEDDDFFTWW